MTTGADLARVAGTTGQYEWRTTMLRWNKTTGNLEQAWEIREYMRGQPTSSRIEWREIPWVTP